MINISVSEQTFKQMSISDLKNFAECARTIANVIGGIMEQPRFSYEDGYTKAGEIFDDLVCFVNELLDCATNRIDEFKPKTIEEAQAKFYALMVDRSHLEYSLSDILGVISTSQREIEQLEFAQSNTRNEVQA